MVIFMLRRIKRHWQGIVGNPSRRSRMQFAAQQIMGYCTPSSSGSVTGNDPMSLFLGKGFQLHTVSPHSCAPFVNGPGRGLAAGGGGGGGGGIAIGIGLNGSTLGPNLKCCCSRDDDIEAVAFHKGKGKGKAPRAFAPHQLNLLRLSDLAIRFEDRTSSTDNATATANQTEQEASHHGSALGFLDRPMPDKIVVAVDVDEVLGSFVSALNRFIADRYLSNHSLSEYYVYEFFKIWNCSRDEANIRVHEFFKTSYFKTGIQPIPGARRALHKLSRFCNLSVVTYVIQLNFFQHAQLSIPRDNYFDPLKFMCITRSRQNAIKDHTIDWIGKHYPGLFQEIHFGNHFALDGASKPKSELCRSLGASVLIDDNPRYAIECAEVGIRVLLFDYENSYPWCKTEFVDEHPMVTKVHNWEEVEQQLVSTVIS